MNSTPRLSIIIPTYNCSEFLEETLESIFKQSFQDYEIICIDDNSSDDTVTLIERFQVIDSRIILLRNEINNGPSFCRNMVILRAKGEFVSSTDSDDIYHKDKFLNQIKYLDANPKIDVCGTFKINFGLNTIKSKMPIDPEKIKTGLLFSSVLAHPSVLSRRQFLINNNLLYNTEYIFVEDYELWFRISLIGNIGNLPQYLTYYRVHKNQMSGNTAQMNYFFSKLKKRQLEYLGIKGSPKDIEVFSKFCHKNLKSKKELLKVLLILDQIILANLSLKIYSPEILKNTISRYLSQNIIRGKNLKFSWLPLIFSNGYISSNLKEKINFLYLIIITFFMEIGKLFHKTEFP